MSLQARHTVAELIAAQALLSPRPASNTSGVVHIVGHKVLDSEAWFCIVQHIVAELATAQAWLPQATTQMWCTFLDTKCLSLSIGFAVQHIVAELAAAQALLSPWPAK
jgi:hypothetical protein